MAHSDFTLSCIVPRSPPSQLPPISACGLRSGSWPDYFSYFCSLQSQLAGAGSVGGGGSGGVRVKSLYLLRHAEGTHNAAESFFGTPVWDASESLKDEYEDPALTEKGRGQCEAFARGLPKALAEGFAPQLVICSPLQRTMQTAALCLDALPAFIPSSVAAAAASTSPGASSPAAASSPSSSCSSSPSAAAAGLVPLPWVALECARETLGSHTCDRRGLIDSSVEARFPRLQFQLLRERHDALWTHTRESHEQRLLRAHRILDFVFAAPEDHVILVAHSEIFGAISRLIAKPFDAAEFPINASAASAAATSAAPASAQGTEPPQLQSSVHSLASVLEVHRADGALDVTPIHTHHCTLQPFCIARIPISAALLSDATVAASAVSAASK